MSVPTRLAGFGLAVLVAFVAAFGIGRAVGPFDEPVPAPPSAAEGDDGHAGDHP